MENYLSSITRVVTAPVPVMSQKRIHRLGDLQLQIMQALWHRHEATVAEVHADLAPSRPLAYTTVATMLRRMEARGLTRHRVEGRTFIYRAVVESDAVSGGMADHLLNRFFQGRLADLVSHLLTTREVSRAELSQLERLIADHKRSR
jgi:BlaI family transcriptional regulator, penicillinase repressor